jgi:hypothetical protein
VEQADDEGTRESERLVDGGVDGSKGRELVAPKPARVAPRAPLEGADLAR